MVPGILQKNVRSWDTLELSTLIVGLPRTAVSTLYPVKKTRKRENNALANNTVEEILLNETQKVSAAREATGFL